MKFEVLTSEIQIRDLISFHNERSRFCVLDTEGTDKLPRKAKLVDVQMSGYSPDHAVMFGAEYAPLLKELTCLQVWQNFKWDWKVLYLHGVDLRGKPVRDTMLMHHLEDENSDHDLETIIGATDGPSYKSEFWAKYKNYTDSPLDARLEYGCRDIIETSRVYERITAGLVAQGVPDALVDHVHRLALCLLDTELAGIRIDLGYLTELGKGLQEGIAKTDQELRQLGGLDLEILEYKMWQEEISKAYKPKGKKWLTIPKPEFNFTSSSQVARLLYQQLELEPVLHQKTKKPTADDGALEQLESKHPLIPKLRSLRELAKMHGSFIEGILDRMDGERIYPSFNVNGTATGRISHSDPNMGQMPSRGEWSKIRGVFLPEPGHKLISADYGQLEVCIAAHFSQDENLLKIINEGASQHDITSQSLGIERSLAKTLNFGMQYLCSPFKVRELLGCGPSQAENVWKRYWDTYRGLKAFIDNTVAQMEHRGFVETPFGRRRRFPNYSRPKWSNPEKGLYTKEMRQAFNAVIQGTGADITSRAFYLVAERLKQEGWGSALFTVHDELIVQAKDEYVEQVRELVVSTMTGVGQEIGLTVALKVDCSVGLERWEK